MLWSGKGLTSFTKYNSANFLVKKKVQRSFPECLFLEKYVKKNFKKLILIVVLVLES